MSESKICPLLSISDDPSSLSQCEGARCAWYIPPLSRHGEGRCAVQMMSMALVEIADGVRHL